MNQRVSLLYHGIVTSDAVLPADRENGAERYDVSVETFVRQLEYIQKNGFSAVTLGDGDGGPAAKSVVLTFDDGEKNNAELARPVLQRFGYPAYFFVTANRVGHKGYMDWEDLRELRDLGMIIGSHGMSHRILTALKAKEIEWELMESKDLLEKNLLVDIKDFSVPHGFYDERVLNIARAVGYQHVFVSERSPRDEMCYGRESVMAYWSLARFASALEHRVPWPERIFDFGKGCAKRLLGGTRYDAFRNQLLRLMK